MILQIYWEALNAALSPIVPAILSCDVFHLQLRSGGS